MIAGEVAATQTLSLDAGQEQTATLNGTAPSQSGEYNWYVRIGDSQSETYTLTVSGNNSNSSPLSGTAGEYDSNGDGQVTASELGSAIGDFGSGDLSAAELGEVVNAFGQS